ncbi:ABC transporter substrate-binding protein [Paenibacillus guangzhouensis]|uniref:ABC transporter substrate-binding protein n=1 Tax=Paenibacillus guangzhouensis TaxID=1473112 RepID=UPI00187B8A54|nr:extracellular solute-binding protein [Paenibacillus guangzhouensis]
MKFKPWGCVGLAGVILLSGCSGGKEAASPKMSDDGKKIVVVGTKGSTRFLQEAEKKFEAAHPDIDIQLKKYGTPEKKNDGGGMQVAPEMTQEEYDRLIQQINTEVLSGKGPDVIDTTGLSLGVYANKGAIEDLHERMKKDSSFKPSDYYEGIWQASEINGGLYALPTSFFIENMMVDTRKLQQAGVKLDDTKWTWKDFFDIAIKVKASSNDEVYALGSNSPKGDLLFSIVESEYDRYVQHDQKTANFDSDEFRQRMQQVKDLYDQGFITQDIGDKDKLIFSQNTMSNSGLLAVMTYLPGWKSILPPTEAGGAAGPSFKAYGGFAINAKSGVKDEAWAFMKFLLSPEMQQSSEFIGIPMLKELVKAQFEESKKLAANKDAFIQIDDADAFNQHVDGMLSLLDQPGKPFAMDPKIQSMMREEFDTFMVGQKSAEEVSKLIQSRVTTYLNE